MAWPTSLLNCFDQTQQLGHFLADAHCRKLHEHFREGDNFVRRNRDVRWVIDEKEFAFIYPEGSGKQSILHLIEIHY